MVFDQGVGCVTILPAAAVGFTGLADGIGPTGWRGFAELFGWTLACLIAAALVAMLLERARRGRGITYPLALVAVAGFGVVGYERLCWLGLDAPMSAKTLFTSSMQASGALGAVACVLSIAVSVAKDRRR